MRDLHMHSVYSDGKNTAEEMIQEAIRLGLDTVGLSDHSHAKFDECGMTAEGTKAYRTEMAELKREYAGRIQVLCGLERDYYSDDFQENNGKALKSTSAETGMPLRKPITRRNAGLLM